MDVRRTDNSILPSGDELSRILETEVARDLPVGKNTVHYPNFETIVNILSAYNLPTDIFTDGSLTIHDVVSRGRTLLDDAMSAILSQKPERELFDKAYEYLSEEDLPQKSDLIFIFGSKTPLRAQKAAELYKAGLGEKVLVSGGSPIYAEANTLSEAQSYREILLRSGVLDEAIILEESAITLPDNVRRSLNLLDEMSERYDSIILVNSPYSQRRGWTIFRKHLSDDIKLYRVNSGCAEEYTKDSWYKQEKTLRIILNEFIKMRASVVYNTA